MLVWMYMFQKVVPSKVEDEGKVYKIFGESFSLTAFLTSKTSPAKRCSCICDCRFEM